MKSNDVWKHTIRAFDTKPWRGSIQMLSLWVTSRTFLTAIKLFPVSAIIASLSLSYIQKPKEIEPCRASEKCAGDAADTFLFSLSATRSDSGGPAHSWAASPALLPSLAMQVVIDFFTLLSARWAAVSLLLALLPLSSPMGRPGAGSPSSCLVLSGAGLVPCQESITAHPIPFFSIY